jgi:transposase
MTPPDRHVTGGVGTHGDVQVAAALGSATGRNLGTDSFPTTTAGYFGLLEWLRGFGELDQVGVESTGSYGAGLMRLLRAEDVEVIEVDRPDRKARRFEGKSGPADAQAAARAVLSGRARHPTVGSVKGWWITFSH